MSNMQDDEFREDELPPEEVDADLEDGGDAPAAKKTSLPMMAAMGLGVAAVVGFAGFQVYSKMAPAPSQQTVDVVAPPVHAQQQQAAVPAPATVPALPVDQAAMPGGAAAPLGGPVGAQVPAVAPVAAAVSAPAGLPVGTGVQPVEVGAAASATALAAASGVATPAAVTPAGLALSGGPVNMDAIAALKRSQEAQGKQMDDISARLQRLETRLAELAGSGRAAKSQSVAEEDDDAKARKTALRKARLKKAKELAAKRAEERKRKASDKDVKVTKPADKPRAKNVVKSSEVLPDAPAPKRSVPVVDLPPAPIAETPAPKKPQAEEQLTVRVTGLRIQAVIPGRVWIADEGGVARSYSVGDAVRAGVVIRSIDAEKGVVTTSAGLIR